MLMYVVVPQIQPAAPAAYSFLAGKYVPELPSGMFNAIQWYMQVRLASIAFIAEIGVV